MTNAEIQRALVARGYFIGRSGPKKDGVDGLIGDLTTKALKAFQASQGLAQTGMPNALTQAALAAPVPVLTTAQRPGGRIVPADWMPNAKMSRIVVHWTAGAHRASADDRKHYHLLIEGDGDLVRGVPTIDLNGEPNAKKGYAEHTLHCNTGSIGISLCCMMGAMDVPFSRGAAPMTTAQWERLPLALADLCDRYAISVSPQTVLSHAEVQRTLGIRQRGKIDIMWTPGMIKMGDAIAIGNGLRAQVAKIMRSGA